MCKNKSKKTSTDPSLSTEQLYYVNFRHKPNYKTFEEELKYATTTYKKCNKCSRTLSLINFSGNTSGDSPFNKNGYRYRRGECISCTAEYRKEKKEAEKLAKANGIPAKAPEGTVCYNCGRGGNLCFDHDHDGSKSFRGWLCNNCNIALGILKSNGKKTDFDGLMSMLAYLITYQKSPDIRNEYSHKLNDLINSHKLNELIKSTEEERIIMQ
jgi:hypothetical protein